MRQEKTVTIAKKIEIENQERIQMMMANIVRKHPIPLDTVEGRQESALLDLADAGKVILRAGEYRLSLRGMINA